MYRKISDNQYQNLESKAFFGPGSNEWNKLQEWIAGGGTPNPEFTDDQLKDRLKSAVAKEGRRRIDAYGPATGRDKDRKLMRSNKLLRQASKLYRKDIKTGLTAEDETNLANVEQELDALETICDDIESTEQLIESISLAVDGMDRAALEAYDPVNDPGWTI